MALIVAALHWAMRIQALNFEKWSSKLKIISEGITQGQVKREYIFCWSESLYTWGWILLHRKPINLKRNGNTDAFCFVWVLDTHNKLDVYLFCHLFYLLKRVFALMTPKASHNYLSFQTIFQDRPNASLNDAYPHSTHTCFV